ncbi:MFS transporter [Streptomyces caatingaensis]|uniref:Tetracenomycin C resistance and export protein n=1 Tax=Streptomyces caatingaensis TaxID=1678637 RepID=A0A0K9XL56_9ACTN|nr:MFS transporter [Streptomyces caatingaensis]KNB53412.1 tetracenomycin C resistance and export protein [Streptomyces caatingaensis]
MNSPAHDEPLAAARPREAGLRGRPWPTLLAVAVGVMMVALDSTIVAMANPAIQQDLGASLADVQWITNGYLLALAVSLITAGKLGDRFGHRQTFLVGVAGFAATSAAIGLSGSVAAIVVFRVLQGLFGALMQPSALGLLRVTFPPERLNMAIGIWSGVVGAATAAGPIIGGLLVQHVSWEAVFMINVPVGAAALAVGVVILKDTRADKAPESFDVPGIALLSAAMFCLVWGLIKAPAWGWGDLRTLGFLLAAVVAFAGFALREGRAGEPLVPLSMFHSTALSAGTVLMVLMSFSFIGGLFFVTFYLQNVHGMSPVSSGVHLLPLTGMMIVGAPVSGAVISRFGPRPPLVAGMLLTAAALWGMSTLEAGTGMGVASCWFVLLGLGLAPVMVGTTDVIVSNAPAELAGVAGGLQQSAMQVGGSLGTAVLGVLMASRVKDVLPGEWSGAGLPPLAADRAGAVEDAAKVGVAPSLPGLPRGAVAEAVHASFISGMGLAFVVGAVVAVAGAGFALFTRKGQGGEPPAAAGRAEAAEAAAPAGQG